VSADEPRTYRTRSGRVLTDADIEALAEEADRGYDVEKLRPLSVAEREELLRLLERAMVAARATGQETLGEHLLDTLDFVSHWCSPHMKVPVAFTDVEGALQKLLHTPITFDPLRDPNWIPSREDYRFMRDGARGKLAFVITALERIADDHSDERTPQGEMSAIAREALEQAHTWKPGETTPAHPLDDEEIRVEVTHVPTGMGAMAEDDPGTPVGETVGRALDELLRCIETAGGG
jgi:hypothetical protein